ncbi:hypothetical protein QN277_023543 [Acacia crassicarpa]|uniref:GDSL esterase/lipase n=1 Tax=Acacia crassicarpa TaxID=499986 RepID=A0AAE1KBH0_9FABA|nr:hypothetical protein QN277_023543 [Acacia crassicarpa]
MERKILILFLSFCFVSHQSLIVNALVPAVYVFGDSHVDAGNNALLDTPAQANRWPYGIDFNNITGRFTNGKNIADFIATYLNLPMPPAYLNLTDAQKSQTTTGMTYASGSCGILTTTGAGKCLRLAQQVDSFTSTVTKDLPNAVNDRGQLQQYLANSLYLVLIGNNDYNEKMSQGKVTQYPPSDYADLLLNEVTKQITTIYNLGARKFVVLGISYCAPQNYTIPDCRSRYYADKLPQTLQQLECKLTGSKFTVYDYYQVYSKITANPQNYGITNLVDPCYPEGGSVCPDRSKYFRFDQYSHQTQVAYETAAKECFTGTACSPLTISDLVKA